MVDLRHCWTEITQLESEKWRRMEIPSVFTHDRRRLRTLLLCGTQRAVLNTDVVWTANGLLLWTYWDERKLCVVIMTGQIQSKNGLLECDIVISIDGAGRIGTTEEQGGSTTTTRAPDLRIGALLWSTYSALRTFLHGGTDFVNGDTGAIRTLVLTRRTDNLLVKREWLVNTESGQLCSLKTTSPDGQR